MYEEVDFSLVAARFSNNPGQSIKLRGPEEYRTDFGKWHRIACMQHSSIHDARRFSCFGEEHHITYLEKFKMVPVTIDKIEILVMKYGHNAQSLSKVHNRRYALSGSLALTSGRTVFPSGRCEQSNSIWDFSSIASNINGRQAYFPLWKLTLPSVEP